MNKVTDTVLTLVRADVFGAQADVEETAEFISDKERYAALLKTASAHDLAHLVGSALERLGLLGDDEISAVLRRRHFASVLRYRTMEYELEAVCAALSEGKIAHIPLKGAVMRRLYPEPRMRTSCDIDVLVHPEDIDAATEIFEKKLGYKLTSRCFHDVAFFSESGVHIELHFDLIEQFAFPEVERILSDVRERAVPSSEGAYTYAMPDDVFYFYHVAHMMKHFLDGGCGIRFFLDLYILDNIEGRDLAAREELLERGGILKFARRSSALARIWFADEPTSDFYESFGKYVVDGGIYGGVENKVLVQQKRRGGKLGYALSRIFLPYRILSEIYPVLKRHKWLTPVFEVVRWFRIIFRGKLSSSVGELRSNASVSEESANAAAQMLATLGLDARDGQGSEQAGG